MTYNLKVKKNIKLDQLYKEKQNCRSEDKLKTIDDKIKDEAIVVQRKLMESEVNKLKKIKSFKIALNF